MTRRRRHLSVVPASAAPAPSRVGFALIAPDEAGTGEATPHDTETRGSAPRPSGLQAAVARHPSAQTNVPVAAPPRSSGNRDA